LIDFLPDQVTEPDKVDYDAVGSSVSSAVGSGNPQEATQVTNAVSSVLNSKAEKSDASNSSAEEERANVCLCNSSNLIVSMRPWTNISFHSRFQFRGEIAKSLTNMPADSFDGVAQKGEALNALTQATGEVKEDAQV
jgi:hypothetical protein